MSDANKDGIPDNIEKTFKKGLIVGIVAGVFGGGASLSVAVWAFPQLAGLLAIFAGGVCDPVKLELGRYKEAIACYEARAQANSIDDELCKSKLVVDE